MRKFRLLAGLALFDYLHEKLLSLCAVVALTAILTPLLVISGVKNGVVTTLLDRLKSNPGNMSILLQGSGKFTPAWFETMRKDKEMIQFIMPQTRSLAAIVTLVSPQNQNTQHGVDKWVECTWLATGEGDPELITYGVDIPVRSSLVISQTVAEKLDLKKGEIVTALAERTTAEKKRESHAVMLTVTDILPLEAGQKDVAYVPLDLLLAVEAYRDGGVFPEDPFADNARTEREYYPRFRLYARTIDHVEPLRERMNAKGMFVHTKASEIVMVKRLDHSLSLIILLIALVAGSGFVAFTVSNCLASVRRKEKQLGLLRLMGFSRFYLSLFPIGQSLMTASLGSAFALILYGLLAISINSLFGGQMTGAEQICNLDTGTLALIFLLVFSLSILSSLNGALYVAKLEPSEVIREI